MGLIQAEPFALEFNSNTTALEMIKAQDGMFGWVAKSANFLKAIS